MDVEITFFRTLHNLRVILVGFLANNVKDPAPANAKFVVRTLITDKKLKMGRAHVFLAIMMIIKTHCVRLAHKSPINVKIATMFLR